MPSRAALISEKELQQAIIDYAKMRGWRVYHTYDSRKSEPGYPDLHLVRGPRSIFVELKKEGKKPTVEQVAWLEALREAGHETYVWYPEDWLGGEVEEVLD